MLPESRGNNKPELISNSRQTSQHMYESDMNAWLQNRHMVNQAFSAASGHTVDSPLLIGRTKEMGPLHEPRPLKMVSTTSLKSRIRPSERPISRDVVPSCHNPHTYMWQPRIYDPVCSHAEIMSSDQVIIPSVSISRDGRTVLGEHQNINFADAAVQVSIPLAIAIFFLCNAMI